MNLRLPFHRQRPTPTSATRAVRLIEAATVSIDDALGLVEGAEITSADETELSYAVVHLGLLVDSLGSTIPRTDPFFQQELPS